MCWQSSTGPTKRSFTTLSLKNITCHQRNIGCGSSGAAKPELMSNTQPFNVIVPPHGCAVVTVQVKDTKPAYLGSDLHISQGMEVVEWKVDEKVIHATLRLPRKTSGHVVIATPGVVNSVTVNDRKVEGKVISARHR